MENLYGVLGQNGTQELLAGGGDHPVGISMEPGNGTVPAGALIYRKSGGLFAPAQAAQLDGSKELLVLRDEIDTTANAGVAAAAAAYEGGVFLAGKVLLYDGSSEYAPVSGTYALVLRQQGITFRPFDDWREDDVTADNRLALAVTVTADANGSASADKQTAKKGEIVTLTATPASNYELDKWVVSAGDVTIGSDNKFVMGDKAVAVKATFKAAV